MDLSQIQAGIEMGSSSLESMLACSKAQGDRKPRPMEEHALKCPRCDSINTKFCYYNNYSLSQPRYFCKACRRYWTKGGTLRNVPVGGGCRKNKRSSSSPSSFTSMAKRIPDQQPPLSPTKSDTCLTVLPSFSCDSAAFSRIQQQSAPHIDELSLFTNRTGLFPRMNVGQSVTQPWWSSCQNVDTCSSFGGMGGIEEMMPHLEEERSCSKNSVVTVAAMKHEGCCVGEEEESRLLWGIPWKMVGEGNVGDANNVGRESWVSLGSSSWHGLLNSTII